MAVIRFDANVPVEVALKFDGGKEVTSRIPDAPNQMMYSLCGDDTIYLPLSVAAQISQLGIKKLELISICKRQQGGVTRWEVKRVGDTATAAIATRTGFDALPTAIDATPIERQLTDSINQANQAKAQRALITPAVSPSTVVNGTITTPNSTPAPIAHTTISRLMAASLIAAFDASQECERYAHSKGTEFEFSSEDIRAISNTIFIALSKDPNFGKPQQVNGGAHSWQQ
jgi:hypothetical protein